MIAGALSNGRVGRVVSFSFSFFLFGLESCFAAAGGWLRGMENGMMRYYSNNEDGDDYQAARCKITGVQVPGLELS
jgi:hypothetical protein